MTSKTNLQLEDMDDINLQQIKHQQQHTNIYSTSSSSSPSPRGILSSSSSASTFRILVASDNHVGYKETDSIRGEDSFEAFEEVFKIAQQEKVDFIILGGDLFHETNPSQQCLYKMMTLFSKYVFGSGEITYQVPNYSANFQDSNMNIELPVFAIHGNHDYPQDECGNLSVLDLFHTTKYLNHFGKFTNNDKIKMTPIIFTKGDTVIALYGIGYMKDKHFHKMLEDKAIEFVKPSELGYDKTVSILVIHQSRFKGVKAGQAHKNCVHPEQFPVWFDLIIRGHEHEQIDEVGKTANCSIKVVQPGSTIPTNLIPSEATPRRAVLFEIKGQDASFQDIILVESYRPVLCESIEMRILLRQIGIDIFTMQPSEEEVETVLWGHIQSSMQNFKQVLEESFPNRALLKKKPQMRFKVEHSGMDTFNLTKLESRIGEFVSNPGEVFKFWKRPVQNPNQYKNQKNPKLDENFLRTLREKEDFDTIGNDTVKDIRDQYEQRVSLGGRVHCLPTSLIMDSLETVNQRNRNSHIEDIIKTVQEKLETNVVRLEENEVRKINRLYRQQMKDIIDQISGKIQGGKNFTNSQTDRIAYRSIMDGQFDCMRTNLTTKIREKIVELYKSTTSQGMEQEVVLVSKQTDNNEKAQRQQQQSGMVNNSSKSGTQPAENKLNVIQGTKKQPNTAKLEGNSATKAEETTSNNAEITLPKKFKIVKQSQPENTQSAGNSASASQDASKKKMTYQELFGGGNNRDRIKKEGLEEDEQEEEDTGIDLEDNSSQQSDCEFNTETNARISLHSTLPPVSFLNQFRKETSNMISSSTINQDSQFSQSSNINSQQPKESVFKKLQASNSQISSQQSKSILFPQQKLNGLSNSSNSSWSSKSPQQQLQQRQQQQLTTSSQQSHQVSQQQQKQQFERQFAQMQQPVRQQQQQSNLQQQGQTSIQQPLFKQPAIGQTIAKATNSTIGSQQYPLKSPQSTVGQQLNTKQQGTSFVGQQGFVKKPSGPFGDKADGRIEQEIKNSFKTRFNITTSKK